VDSKAVNKRIRREIRPLLRENGFSRSTERTFWRHRDSQVDVVNFQSFNDYNASVSGFTTYSFAVNLGCYLLEVPESFPSVKRKDGVLLPQEYDCHFRGRLRKHLQQPELDSTEIWFIDPEAKYLDRALHDVRMAFLRDAVPWFSRLENRDEVLRILVSEQEMMASLWGFGNAGSPCRHYMTGYVARALGRYDLAQQALQAAASTSTYAAVADRLRNDAGAPPNPSLQRTPPG
jgi:hypothetical protein